MIRIRQTINGCFLDEPVWTNLINANTAYHEANIYTNKRNLYVAFVNYLNWLITYCRDELNGKKYRDNQIIQKVFITKATKENQIKEYLKYSLVSLKEYASHLLEKLKYDNLDNYYTLIVTLMTDAGYLIREYETKCKGRAAFMLPIGGRKSMKAWDLLNASLELFNIETIKDIKQLSLIDLKPNVMFQIRQLLEIVGKNIIGFEAVVGGDGKPIHQFTQVAWKFLCSEKCRRWSVSLPYAANDILAINSWANSFVHTTYFNTCYLQYYALRIVRDLMLPTHDTDIFGRRWSLNIGKYEIDGYYYMRKDFSEYVRKQNKFAHVVWKPLKEVGAYIKSTGNPNILFVMHMPPPVHGASMMGKAIKESKLINGRFDCNYINLATASSISDIGKFSFNKIKAFWKLLTDIRKGVKTKRPELVYITPNAKGGAFFKDFVVVQMLKRMGCRVVVHYHNKGVATKQSSKLYDWFYHRFFKNLNVVLLSPTLYCDVKMYVKPTDVYYCANGIEGTNAGRTPIRHNPIPKLLFLSNMIESKGVLTLLDALKILKDNGHSFECTFVGAESQEIGSDRFKHLVNERGLSGFATYIGKKYGAEKHQIYETTDIFVFPTFYHNECFPLVLLEAMENAIPCISTNEGAISDIIDDGHTGFVIEKQNPTQLAEKIALLLNDEKLRENMGTAGKIKFEENFTLNKFEERMAEILGICLANIPHNA